MLSKAQFKALKRDAQHLAVDIGLRPAARALGLPEERVKKWAQRDKWNISLIRPQGFKHAQVSPQVPDAIEVKTRLLASHSDRTRLGLALASTNASEHLATLPAESVVKPANAIAMEQVSRTADRVHGWTQSRTQAPTVQIANIVLPSAEERAKLDAIDRKLDAFVGKYLKRGTST